MTTTTLTMRMDDALHFVQAFELPIFPCGADKRPLVKGWQEKATTDRETIMRWWTQWPHALIGCPTGHGFWVVDLDMKKGQNGIEEFKELARRHQPGIGLMEQLFPNTTRVLTPTGGMHLWWLYPDGVHIPNSVRALGPGIDVRGEGGYVIVPARGSGYEWAEECPAAEAPSWLLDLVVKVAKAGGGSGAEVEEIAEGERYDRLFRIGASLRGRVLSQEGIRAALLVENESRCKPPLSAEEVETIAHQAGQYPPGIEEREPPPPPLPGEAVESEQEGPPSETEAAEMKKEGGDTFSGGKTRLDAFIAFPPENRFLHMPTGVWWTKDGVNAHLKPVPIGANSEVKAATWLMRNRAVQQVSWLPGQPRIVRDRGFDSSGQWQTMPGHRILNTWQPATPLPGEARLATPWLDHLQELYPEHWEHLLHWLAHRVQRPGEKVNHAIVLGGGPGIGKDTLLEPVVQAVGPRNSREINPIVAAGQFNDFVESVLLRVSESRDQGGKGDKYSLYEHMKPLTAAPPTWIEVSRKFRDPYPVPNCVGIVYTTNHSTDCLYLPADDRRHFVCWSPVESDDAWEQRLSKLWDWYYQGGLGHVGAYLREVDLSSFDPKRPPSKTRDFKTVAMAQNSQAEVVLADFLETIRQPAVFTTKFLRAVAVSMQEHEIVDQLDGKNRAIGHWLGRLGYAPVMNPQRVDGRWWVAGKRAVIYGRRNENQEKMLRLVDAFIFSEDGF